MSSPVIKYIKRNCDILPSYWMGEIAKYTISDVDDMLARGLHSESEIAELFECPVALIRIIHDCHKAAIDALRLDFAEFEASMKCISPVPSSPDIDIYDFQNMLDDIANAYSMKG